MGKRSIEERIQEEAGFLLVELRKTKGICDTGREGYKGTWLGGCGVVCRELSHEKMGFSGRKFGNGKG